jgi:hypothetical protein
MTEGECDDCGFFEYCEICKCRWCGKAVIDYMVTCIVKNICFECDVLLYNGTEPYDTTSDSPIFGEEPRCRRHIDIPYKWPNNTE